MKCAAGYDGRDHAVTYWQERSGSLVRKVRARDLIAKVSTSGEPWSDQVIALLSNASVEVINVDVVPAAQIHDIYSVRLAAQRAGAGPHTDNLEGFVHAATPPGTLELFSIRNEAQTWIVMLREGHPPSYVRIWHDG